MSATSETLLLQIVELENRLLESHARGEDCSQLEETLLLLKGKFITMNEALGKTQGILKG
jgi:hypothetical protein